MIPTTVNPGMSLGTGCSSKHPSFELCLLTRPGRWSPEWPQGPEAHSAQVDIARGDGSQWDGAVQPIDFTCGQREISLAKGASEKDMCGFALYPLSSVHHKGKSIVQQSLSAGWNPVPDSNVKAVVDAIVAEAKVSAAEVAQARSKTATPLSNTIPVPTSSAEMQGFIGTRTMERFASDLIEHELAQERQHRLAFKLTQRCATVESLGEIREAIEEQLAADQQLVHRLVADIDNNSHEATRIPHGHGTTDSLPLPYTGTESRVRYMLAQSAWKETTNITSSYSMAAAMSSTSKHH